MKTILIIMLMTILLAGCENGEVDWKASYFKCLAERDKYSLALDKAAYALFQIKRIQPDQIAEFAERSHAEACAVLDTLSTNKQEGE